VTAADTASPWARRLEPALGALAFVAPLAAYATTLASTITFGDAGELAVAATKLGIGHPPGYPLAAMAGQLVTLVPLGPIARATNLASAFAAAGACSILYLLLRRLFLALRPGARVPAAVAAAAAAVAFGFGRTVWSQAVVTEVYAFGALAAAAVLYAGLDFASGRDARWGYAAAFMGGLALAAHFSSFLIILPLACYMWFKAGRPPARAWFLGGAFALLGLSVYLYLPLRAAQGPALNWGDPRTFGAAADHVMRKGMGGVVPARLQFLPRHLLELGAALWRESAALTVAAITSVVIAVARRRAPWRFIALSALITGPVATVLLVLTLRADQAGEMAVWYIPFFMTAGALAGLALFTLLNRPGAPWKAAGGVAAAAVALLPLALNFGANDYRGYYFAADHGANLLRTMDYEGVAFMFEKDFGTYEIAYHRSGEGRRPDAEFVSPVVGLLPGFEELARERREAAGAEDAARVEWQFEAAFLPLSSERTVYYNSMRENALALGYNINQEGLMYRVSPGRPSAAAGVPAVWQRYETRGFADAEARPTSPRLRRDVWLRSAICVFRIKEALQYFGAGDVEGGFDAVARAEPLAYGLFEPLANLGGIYLAHGQPARAAAFFDRAARAVPRAGVGDEYFRVHYARILAMKGDAYSMAGDADAAEAAYREASEAFPAPPGSP
jgi:tetratricopeptide (TPR) repeat protein